MVTIQVMIFETHLHTTLSSCSRLDVHEAIDRAKELGLDGICITDHDTMDVRRQISEGVQPNGLRVVFGQEYTTDQGDFLIFGPFEDLLPGLPAERLLRLVQRNGGVAVAAHPFRENRSANESLIRSGLVGAMESLNGRNTRRENQAADQWRRFYQPTELGGSDAHAWDEVGRYVTRFQTPINSRNDLIRAIKRGWCQPEVHADSLLTTPTGLSLPASTGIIAAGHHA